MALYRLEMQNVSRANGVSSVAKASYRHRSIMIDERTGEIHGEKSANRDDLVYAEILAPDNTPDFLIKSSNFSCCSRVNSSSNLPLFSSSKISSHIKTL